MPNQWCRECDRLRKKDEIVPPLSVSGDAESEAVAVSPSEGPADVREAPKTARLEAARSVLTAAEKQRRYREAHPEYAEREKERMRRKRKG